MKIIKKIFNEMTLIYKLKKKMIGIGKKPGETNKSTPSR